MCYCAGPSCWAWHGAWLLRMQQVYLLVMSSSPGGLEAGPKSLDHALFATSGATDIAFGGCQPGSWQFRAVVTAPWPDQVNLEIWQRGNWRQAWNNKLCFYFLLLLFNFQHKHIFALSLISTVPPPLYLRHSSLKQIAVINTIQQVCDA